MVCMPFFALLFIGKCVIDFPILLLGKIARELVWVERCVEAEEGRMLPVPTIMHVFD